MSNTLVAKRYATALFTLAQEKKTLEATLEDARAVKEVFSGNGELIAFLKNPRVTFEQKKQLLTDAFGSLSQDMQSTIHLMAGRQRIDEIADMSKAVIELVNEANSTAEAMVYTTRPLTDAEREAISKVFAAKVGKQSLRIENIVDRTMIGGIKLRIGNRIFDGSVSGKLNRLERQLLTQQ